MKIKPSGDAKLRVLKVIVDECEGRAHKSVAMAEDPHKSGDLWMSLWNIHVAAGYSTEYVRQIVKSLYQEHQALQRTKKGAKFFYRHSAKAQDVIAKLEKAT